MIEYRSVVLLVVIVAISLVGCVSTSKIELFPFDSRVEVVSPYNFYYNCKGNVTEKTWANGETLYFVGNLCDEYKEEYFFIPELKLVK